MIKSSKEEAVKKLIRNSKDDEVMVMCDCGGTDHHLFIMRMENDEDSLCQDEYYFDITPVQTSFFRRLSKAWDLLWHGEQPSDEVILHEDQVEELANTLLEVVERGRNRWRQAKSKATAEAVKKDATVA